MGDELARGQLSEDHIEPKDPWPQPFPGGLQRLSQSLGSFKGALRGAFKGP